MNQEFDPSVPRLSRTLLFPGPLPPNSHLGVTLLRHVVATGLRSALHRLGLPLLPSPPVRIVQLRLYLDRDALAGELGEAPGAAEAIGGLLDPGGVATPGGGGSRLAGAGLIHRLRLLVSRPSRPAPASTATSPDELRGLLSALLPSLSDALLADLMAALDRRRRRATGRRRPDCASREAWRFQTGRRPRLDCLGPPEPLLSSWAVGRAPERPTAPPPPPDRHRGRFRERYRAALDLFAPAYRRLAERAAGNGLIDHPDDAFFLPFDLIDDLVADRRPDWLPAAVAANRREYLACRSRPSPPDRIDSDVSPEAEPTGAPLDDWELCPLNPLP